MSTIMMDSCIGEISAPRYSLAGYRVRMAITLRLNKLRAGKELDFDPSMTR